MNKWRIIGLTLVTLLAAGLVLRSCTPDEQQPVPPPPPAREAFHASKPIQVAVTAAADEAGKTADVKWLEYELRHLLSRGKMRVASVMARTADDTFTLRIEMAGDAKQATLTLVAPDQVIERHKTVPLAHESRLDSLSAIAAQLPRFLDAAHTSTDWSALIGTDNAKAYETFLTSAMELLGPAGQGFTRPPAAPQRTRTVERLEALTRSHPRFARAWGTLATGYLSLGGQDEASLAQLAESSAQRALSLDAADAAAHAALGLVHLRRNEWIAAREQFDRALSLDIDNAPALEGLACLLVDAGRHEAARPFADHAVFLQPQNAGARQCLAYIHIESPQQLLSDSLSPQDLRQWADPLLRAVGNRRHIPEALRAVTRAASEGLIDPSTEILCGASLRQADFVLNRMSRLQRQREYVPLRILWMPQTAFLRQHPRFEEIISAAGLPAFWQEHGTPDVCAAEPAVYGCKLRPAAPKKDALKKQKE